MLIASTFEWGLFFYVMGFNKQFILLNKKNEYEVFYKISIFEKL